VRAYGGNRFGTPDIGSDTGPGRYIAMIYREMDGLTVVIEGEVLA